MTRFTDNIYSGADAVVSALASRSAVSLTKTYVFAGAGNTTPVTRAGVFPPNSQNLAAELFITNAGGAAVSNKVTVSAGGVDLLTIDQFGSAAGYAVQTTTSIARFTVVASACAILNPPATNQTNGGEIPFNVTFLPVAGDSTGTYQVVLNFNRSDTGGMAGTTS